MQGLIDSTLREGEQAVGVTFSLADKQAIISGLARIGVEEIELGIVNPGDSVLPELIGYARKVAAKQRLALWCRCNDADIDYAATLHPDVLSLSIPASDLHIAKKLAKSRAWVLERAASAIKRAVKHGINFISLGLEDATRADEDFLAALIGVAQESGVARIRLADTVGICTPLEMAALVKRCKEIATLQIGVHTHNDFGMATANAMAAIEAGADWADVTILGLGERAGNARLEEVAGFCSLRRGRAYDTRAIAGLSGIVAQAANFAIPVNQPIIGRNIFACETGLHLQGIMAAPESYEPYDPKRVGAERHLLFGHKIGRGAIKGWLAKQGKSTSPELLDEMAHGVRRMAIQLGRPLRHDELGDSQLFAPR